MATTTTDTTITKRHLTTYLKERTSGAADAPHQGLPFIDGKDNVRIKPSDWCDWLAGQGIETNKKDALQALKDAGLVQKVYGLPKHPDHPDAKSFGLYTGPAPAGTSKLPRRVVQRA